VPVVRGRLTAYTLCYVYLLNLLSLDLKTSAEVFKYLPIVFKIFYKDF
jgi:hypothetical protein